MAVATQMNRKDVKACRKTGNTGMQTPGTARNANARGSHGLPEVFDNPDRVSSTDTGSAMCTRGSRPTGASTQGVAGLPKGSVDNPKGTDVGCRAPVTLNKRRAGLQEGSSSLARVSSPGIMKVRRFQPSGVNSQHAGGITEVSSGCAVDVSAGIPKSSTSKEVKPFLTASGFRNLAGRVAIDHIPKMFGSRVSSVSSSNKSGPQVETSRVASAVTAKISLSRESQPSVEKRQQEILNGCSAVPFDVLSMSSNSPTLTASCADINGLSDLSEGSSRAPDLLDESPCPARSTPKLERHFSFELEDGCLVLAEEIASKSKEVVVTKEKPVKPLRKNLPKAGSPGLKRRLPDHSEGINSIFTGAPEGAKLSGIVGKKSAKVVRGSDVRLSSSVPDRKAARKVENDSRKTKTVKPEVLPNLKASEGGKCDKSGNNVITYKRSSTRDVRRGVGNQDIAIVDLAVKENLSPGVREVPIGLKSGNVAGNDDSNSGSEFRDADGVQKDAERPRAAGQANGGLPEGVGVSLEDRDDGSVDSESESQAVVVRATSEEPILVRDDSPVKLVSQDSGIDTKESIGMFPEYFSCLTQATSTPRRCITLVNDYGDVSEDIGLDKLCGMVTSAEDDLIPHCDQSGSTFCNYQLEGEFGDVSEDLGFERFAQGEPQMERGAFPGTSADSGMFVLDDPYIYDEDYVTCNEEDDEFALNDELMMEVLCANRVNQMTRTYDDVEAMRRLLEEKEKDLELTARIGKELLDRNQELKAQVVCLQAENRSAHESNTQLKHELQQKTQILHALTSDEDGSVVELPSPVESLGKGLPGPILGPIGIGEGKLSARESVARLRRKVDQLELENKALRQEATQLASETLLAEEAETILVEGVAQQLASAVDEKRLLENEVERMRSEERRMREEMELLLERLSEAHKEIERLREENALLSGKIQITTETQDRLAMELADFKEQYQEVSCLLTEAQENLRKVRQKSLPSALTGAHYLSLPITRHGYYGNHPGDSIASELEISMISEMSLDSGIHMPEAQGRIPHYRKVFETYRSASRTSNSPSPSPLHRMPSASSLQGTPSSFAQLSTASTLSASSMNTCRVSAKPCTTSNPSASPRGSSYSNEVPKHLYGNLQTTFCTLDSAGQSEESDHSGMATDTEDCLYPGKMRDGVPGSPGAKELQAALNRLDRERQPQLTKGEKAIGGYEGKSRGSSVDVGPHRWSLSSSSASVCQALPYGCRTPDSIMSTGSSRGSRSSWRMPERLMIMKIREGSQFLDEWSRLATPSLSAALEERPGVKVRGRMTDGVQQHTLMDFEEDDIISESSEDKSVGKDAAPIHPGKFFQSTNSVYTLTNSTVLHPDNTPNVPPSPLLQSPSSPSQQPTPLLSRRSSVSAATPTFSTALGLAKMLHERGISASSSDSLSKGHFTSATVTPCNSPDGSPLSSRSPSPEDANPIASLISSGAELLRRSLGGAQKGAGSSGRGAGSSGRGAGRRANRPPIRSLSRSDRKALAGMKLVEKLERIGLESLMQYSQPVRANQGLVPLTTTLQVGSMYARPMAKSPMAQLTSLKSTLRSRSREEPEETDGPSPAKQKPMPCRRQDLGTVPSSVRKNTQDAASLQSHTARGTISAIFFGRKGGLM